MKTNYQPWRPAYETTAAFGWLIATVWVFYLVKIDSITTASMALLMFVLFMLVIRTLEAVDILRAKWSLLGYSITLVKPEYVKKKMKNKPGYLWLGWGFKWTKEVAQSFNDLEENEIEKFVPRTIRALKKGRAKKGLGMLHGINPNEKDIYIKYDDLAGHCFIPSTTGSLKTRLLALIALQSILRDPKQTVIIIDPKGDPEMLNLIKWACKAANREDDYCYLHPAFPRESVRFDLLKNWTTTTEGPSRVAELMGGDESSAPFKAYGWQVINNIIQGMLGIGERPQLMNLRKYLESGSDILIYKLIRKYTHNLGMNADEEIEKYKGKAQKERMKRGSPIKAKAAVLFYKDQLQENHSLAAIEGLLTMYEHDAAHFSKMIATLQPIMSMLTSDELGPLLSPDYNDIHDKREILDNGRLLRTGRVFYLGLHSMPDATVSGAIGSLYLADLVAVLGERNVRQESEPGITLLLDESNEIVNTPLVSMLNKGRSAGLMVYFFTQTIQDFVSKYGSEAPAMQLLGNSNNLIFGRSLEPSTIEYIMQKAGEVKIQQSQEQFSVNPVGGGRDLTDFGSSYGVRNSKEKEPLINSNMIQAIPDMEFYGVFTGRNIQKCRAPVVKLEEVE